MANIYLGIMSIGLVPLPRIRWSSGGTPSFPHSYPKQADKNVMSDGSVRYDIKSLHPRSWTLQWDKLTPAELARLIDLRDYNGALYFQNNWEDATWRRVVMMKFDYEPALNLGPTPCRYSVSLSLEEVV